MLFSKACEYSIRASVFITFQSMEGNRVNLKEIATAIDSPVAFTAKLLQQLKKHNIINSVQGATGGFEIDKVRMKKVMLCHIVSAIDGQDNITMCLMGLSECSEVNPCPAHIHFKKIKHEMNHMLQTASLWSMAVQMKEGKTYLRI